MRDAAMTVTLTALVRAAGQEVMARYPDAADAPCVKADGSPVTAADLAADAILVAGLARAYPDIPVVTEERAATHDMGLGGAPGGAHFLVDPLDGTREFIARRDEFTVNVALIERGAPVAGVVFAPAQGRLFRTDHAGGAREERDDGRPRPIRVAAPGPEGLRVVVSRSHRDAATNAYIARCRTASVTGTGSSLKFCLIAAGEADLYPRFGRTMEWDTAAGQAVLRAAGGVVERIDGGGPLRYGKHGRENPDFVARAAGVAPPSVA